MTLIFKGSVSIICSTIQDSSPVNTWVTSALRWNVQELVIEVSFNWLPTLPDHTCLFNSKSLTLLRLVCYPFDRRLTLLIPDSVCLPSLKTVFLEFKEFYDDSDGTNNLVSSCPVLESLTIRDCVFNYIDIKISSLSLKHLVLEDNDESHELWGLFKGSVKLITPNLISFRCKDYMQKTYYLEDISSLIKADICMLQVFEVEEFKRLEELSPEVKNKLCAQRMLEFLEASRNVKDLRLSTAILEVFSGSPDLLEAEPIKLCFLSILRLEVDTCLSVDTIPGIAYMLKISPEIKSLFVEIRQIWLSLPTIEENPEAELSLQCLLDKLELVEIQGAVGCVNELKFLEILLKNAKVLRKVVVYTIKKDSPDREKHMKKFTEKLLTFPKASSDVTISFF